MGRRAMEQIMGMRSALRVSQSRESGKITISCPKYGGRYSSMRDLEVAKIRSPFPYGESPYGNGQGE